MTALAGDFLFGIPGNGLWVNDMILGHTYSANLDGYPIELTFPERDDDFGLDHPRAEYHAFGGQSASHEDSAARTVDIVRVVVRTEAPFGAAEFRQDDATRPSEAAFEVFREVRAVAERALKAFLDQTRTKLGHHWMGTSTDLPFDVWIPSLVDTDAGQRIPVSIGRGITMHVLPVEASIDDDTAQRLLDSACAGGETQLPEELIADAKYLAWIREPRDLRLGVLLAAIACETKIKHMLTSLAAEEKQDYSNSSLTTRATCPWRLSRT